MIINTYDPETGTLIGPTEQLDFGAIQQESHPIKPLLFKVVPSPNEVGTQLQISLTDSGWSNNKFYIYFSPTFQTITTGSELFVQITTSSIIAPITIDNFIWLNVDIPTKQVGTTYANLNLMIL